MSEQAYEPNEDYIVRNKRRRLNAGLKQLLSSVSTLHSQINDHDAIITPQKLEDTKHKINEDSEEICKTIDRAEPSDLLKLIIETDLPAEESGIIFRMKNAQVHSASPGRRFIGRISLNEVSLMYIDAKNGMNPNLNILYEQDSGLGYVRLPLIGAFISIIPPASN